MEFYMGQIFEGEYPPEAAIWCNEQGNCYIKQLEGTAQYQIVEIPAPTPEEDLERIKMLNLTAADVERGLYKALGKDFDDIIEMASMVQGVDIKALKIELKANYFYRGNPYVSQIGLLLGLTEQQLDDFFETNDYTKLLSEVEEDFLDDEIGNLL